MMNCLLKEMVNKLPNQLAVKEIMVFFEGEPEKSIMDLSVPLLDEFEGRKRVALIKILTKKIRKHSNLLSLLEMGYEKYLVSEIGYWIELILPKIGLKKFISSLKKQNDQKIIDMVLYKLAFVGGSELQVEIERQLQESGLKSDKAVN